MASIDVKLDVICFGESSRDLYKYIDTIYNFNIRFGYDIFSRKELQPQSRPGTTGLSWGVGFKVKKLKINYSNSKYHFAGTSNNITIIKQLKT